jgi:hypothetical protein
MESKVTYVFFSEDRARFEPVILHIEHKNVHNGNV